MRRGVLFRKYALFFALLVGGALLVSGTVQLVFSYQEEQRALARLEREKAVGAAGRIRHFIREAELHLAGAVAGRSAPQSDAGQNALLAERLLLEFNRVLRVAPALSEIEHIGYRGTQIVLASRLAPNVVNGVADRSREPKFTGANAIRVAGGRQEQPSWFGPVRFKDGSEPYMTIARPEPNEVDGITSVELNLKFIYDVVSQIEIGQNGLAYVVDRSGALVAHPDITLVLRRSELSDLEQVRAALAGAASGDEAFIARGIGGADVITSWERIPELGWTVFVEQPLAEAFAPIYGSLARAFGLLLLGLAVAIVASMILARRMIVPIAALRATAARMGAGALDQRIDIRTGDELEDLAAEFNRMAERLGDSYATLEQKVIHRTRELAAANERLSEATLAKSRFLANMSHELRTPLNAIIGFSEVLLERGGLTPKQEEYLQDILGSGKHQLSLINDILDLSKVEAGRMDLEPSTFSLGTVVHAAVALVREQAVRRSIRLEVSLDPSLTTIRADERKVKQILVNLLSNAVKFTPAEGRIDLAISRAADGVEISVRDTGRGISPEDQSRIFEEFAQAKAGGFSAEGTGLGLTLAQRFVALHGGTIQVESTLGRGSTFTFTLPLEPVPA